MATDRNGKLTFEMVSPGEAWNNFVNSKEGNNAAAVTPTYLDNTKKEKLPPLPFQSKADNTQTPDIATGEQKSQQVLSKSDIKQENNRSVPDEQKAKENSPGLPLGMSKSVTIPDKAGSKTVSKEIERDK